MLKSIGSQRVEPDLVTEQQLLLLLLLLLLPQLLGFPPSSVGKKSAYNAEDPGLIPGLGRFPGEGNGYPLQYSCLENSMDRFSRNIYGFFC